MTDNNTENSLEPEEQSEQQMPERGSYKITATRVFEMDFSERHLQNLMQQAEVDTPEEAIEQVFLQQEIQNIEPEQKLIGVEVKADGPSDD